MSADVLRRAAVAMRTDPGRGRGQWRAQKAMPAAADLLDRMADVLAPTDEWPADVAAYDAALATARAYLGEAR